MAEQSKPDLLYGLAAIGEHIGLTARQAEHMAARRDLPTFNMGRVVCARRSTLAEHFAAQEAKAAAPPIAPPRQQGRAVEVLEGITAVARHLGIPMAQARRLHEARAIPTMVRHGRVEATVAALDDYLAIWGEG